eukprot:gnl/TRDRNA2_/TRDRNA2_151668_c0_seq1.p1 gnl/TRDRNA2_/TRDRNA2_151668_c0~~gnl/TRDRNA2_/TRDRNA2_151668_c0_seq1.p1  ORF type:complete len:469 (+),score=91.08 gnl/TRDRNA2_/TRDRNA2_151668_c0_seq1:83-1489(+)
MPGGKGNVASPHWFEEVFGFAEGPYKDTRDKFQVLEDGIIESKPSGKRFHVGPFEVLSLQDLQCRAASSSGQANEHSGLCFKNVVGNAQTLHRAEENAGAVFQVASQFNCLEMNEPGARPEDGVTRYYNDATQGPACAVVCPAATVFRNYLVEGKGQGFGHQIDCLSGVGEFVNNTKNGYWRMKNGYCLPQGPDSIGKLSKLISNDKALEEAVRTRTQVGVHWDTEVHKQSHRVCQVFCSALPVAYAKSTKSEHWKAFAQVVLEACYDATLAAATCLAAQRGNSSRVKVYLTAVGGGAFGNRSQWIIDAIERALKTHAAAPLDVMLVHFGTLPKGSFMTLEKGRKAPAKNAGLPAVAAAVAKPAGAESKGDGDAAAERPSTPGQQIAAVFARFDLNGNGLIDQKEFSDVIRSLGSDLSDDDISKLFEAADANDDGDVHYAEFAAWLCDEESEIVARVLSMCLPGADSS